MGDTGGMGNSGGMGESLAYSTLPTSSCDEVEAWETPIMCEVADEALLHESRVNSRKGAKAMTKLLMNESCQFVYVPLLPGRCSNIKGMVTAEPCESKEYPGTTTWELITEASWQKQLLDFAISGGFELIDLQSDITMCISIFTDKAYERVPFGLQVAYTAITATTLVMELGIAMHQTKSARRRSSQNPSWEAYATTTILNYLATPVELIVAPFRFSPFGAHKLGRNIGYNTDERNPIILRGESGVVPYLRSRQFLVRLPKVIMENVILFALLIYIQQQYVGKWTGAAIFSGIISFVSAVMACVKTARYLQDVHHCKKFLRQVLDDKEKCVSDSTVDFANDRLHSFPFTCPLL